MLKTNMVVDINGELHIVHGIEYQADKAKGAIGISNDMPKGANSLEDYELVLKFDGVKQIDYLIRILENLKNDVIAENKGIEESEF